MLLPGDGEGLRDPVQFAGWWFGSDFIYGKRPDVEVWLITLQVAAFIPIDQVSQVTGSQRTYQLPAFVMEARKERNISRRKRCGQKQPQPVSTDESDALPGTLQHDNIEAMRLLPSANVLSHTWPPISATVISSLPRSDTPLPSDSASILATPIPYDGVSRLVPFDNPFRRSGDSSALSSREAGGNGGSTTQLGVSPSAITQVSNKTEFLLTLAYVITFLAYSSSCCL